jgi:hypothetical protein
MYNWVTRRKVARTDEPNYPDRSALTVDAIVATWIPVSLALLACAVTPARPKLDVRTYDWQPSSAWIAPIANAPVRTWIPAITTELASTRTDGRRVLDVRTDGWGVDETSWIRATQTIAATVAQTWPAFQESALSARTPDGPRLDVRRYDWSPEYVDTISQVNAQVQTWVPAFRTLSDRTPDRPRLSVRGYEWASDESAWITVNLPVVATVAQTSPAWTNQDENYRTASGPKLDLFRAQSIPSVFGVPDDWITWVPIQDDGARTRDRARLDVRGYDWSAGTAWIAVNLSVVPVTVPQTLPAVQQLDGDRTRDRARLDVRSYEWASAASAWITVNLLTDAQTWPAVLDKGRSYRTPARPALDVRAYEWAPSGAWVTSVSAFRAAWARNANILMQPGRSA